MGQMRIFLSHSSTDRDFADALAKALRDAGADVWYDESHLGTGQLLREISRQLAQRPVFVVVLSKAAFASEWVPRECEWAYNLYAAESNRIILPIVAEPIETSDWYEMLWLESFRRVSGPGNKPYPREEAIKHALNLLALAPAGEAPAPNVPQPFENVDDLITRSKALENQGKHEEALALAERTTKLEPHNLDAWMDLGYLRIVAQQWEGALAAYEQAITVNPKSATAWASKGAVLSRNDRPFDALAAFDQALVIDPTLTYVWLNKGGILQGFHRYDDALAAYDQAIAANPLSADAWLSKARILDYLFRHEEALNASNQVITLDPKSEAAFEIKCRSLIWLKRYDEALEASEQWLTVNADCADAWNFKHTALLMLKRYSEAEEISKSGKLPHK